MFPSPFECNAFSLQAVVDAGAADGPLSIYVRAVSICIQEIVSETPWFTTKNRHYTNYNTRDNISNIKIKNYNKNVVRGMLALDWVESIFFFIFFWVSFHFSLIWSGVRVYSVCFVVGKKKLYRILTQVVHGEKEIVFFPREFTSRVSVQCALIQFRKWEIASVLAIDASVYGEWIFFSLFPFFYRCPNVVTRCQSSFI